MFVFAHILSEGLKDISNVPHSCAKAVFLLSNTLSFCLLPSLASFFLSRSLTLSHSLPVATPRARAKQEASTRSGIHCVSMTRFITAGTLHVSEALLDPESRGWMPFWLFSATPPPQPFISHVFNSRLACVCLYSSPPKNLKRRHPKIHISDMVATLAASFCLRSGPPDWPAPPRVRVKGEGGWSSY